MNKLQLTIRGKVYTMRTDENPERMTQIATLLDNEITEFASAMKGRPEIEILTLTAFDLMEQHDSSTRETGELKLLLEETKNANKLLINEVIASSENKIENLKALLKETEEKNKQLLAEKENTKKDVAAAAEKEKGIEALKAKIREYEQALKQQVAIVCNNENEQRQTVEVLAAENKRLSDVLENFEKTFSCYSKNKERELLRMQEEIETLKLRLAATSDDGQLSLL